MLPSILYLAELMEKAFQPVFNAEDLHKQGNYQAITTVMMYNLPSSPFTMKLLPPMGEANPELLKTMKAYSAAKFGKTRAEVEEEIKHRWQVEEAEMKEAQGQTGPEGPIGELEKVQSEKESFLTAWEKKKARMGMNQAETASVGAPEALGGASKAEALSGGSQNVEAQDEAVFKVKR